MRDPARIKCYMERLKDCWEKVPDWRMSQFLYNLFGAFEFDPFYMEDEQFMSKVENYFKSLCGENEEGD